MRSLLKSPARKGGVIYWALAIGLGLLPLLTMELWKKMARRS
jgi:hypothetical protein